MKQNNIARKNHKYGFSHQLSNHFLCSEWCPLWVNTDLFRYNVIHTKEKLYQRTFNIPCIIASLYIFFFLLFFGWLVSQNQWHSRNKDGEISLCTRRNCSMNSVPCLVHLDWTIPHKFVWVFHWCQTPYVGKGNSALKFYTSTNKLWSNSICLF